MTESPLVSLSVVSHGQSQLVAELLGDLEQLARCDFEVVVTSNVPEPVSAYKGWSYPITLLTNVQPKGFGANHNAAFEHCRGRFFAIVNPDIRATALDLDALLAPFEQSRVGAVAPVILSPHGKVEDSARRFPTFMRLLLRRLGRRRGLDYSLGTLPMRVDWVAGMFVVFRPQAFRELKGFDAKRFFMYMEDVDICERLGKKGWSVLLQPATSVVHAAQRASHRNMKHLRWHIVSAFRYLTSL